MHILANENFPANAVEGLRMRGHDVVWVRTDTPVISDHEVLQWAQREGRIVLTFHKDFGELAFYSRLRASSGVVLFRITMYSAAHIAQVAIAALESRADWGGHFSVIEDDRIRMTPLPVSS